MNAKILPNLLSGTRIALMPALVMIAIAGSREWFVTLLVISLATDALDGFLARRLNAYSDLGRKLDSAADYLTLICGLSGIALLWPDVVRRELPWITVGLAAFFGVIVYGFVRLGRAPCYHTWASKVLAVFTAASLIPLLAGKTAVPFHVAIALQVLVGFEELSIALLVPWHVGEMPSAWHAWRLRRSRRAAPLADVTTERTR
ncbi:MAG TPA: CDP-alcohol phosphatidyltransferase family protein [Opitutaceae bacterium]|nr:CDP-alcohol phosphatidyltransferase family protein [Opitutaceae bacterium]